MRLIADSILGQPMQTSAKAAFSQGLAAISTGEIATILS